VSELLGVNRQGMESMQACRGSISSNAVGPLLTEGTGGTISKLTFGGERSAYRVQPDSAWKTGAQENYRNMESHPEFDTLECPSRTLEGVS